MKTPSRKIISHKAFSLIEIMIVVLIMVVLMGLVFGGITYFSTKKLEDTAKTQVNEMSMHLETYYNTNGTYPAEAEKDPELSSNALYMALFGDYDNDGVPDEGMQILYPALDPAQNKGGKPGNKFVVKRDDKYIITDPWGAAYRYRLGFNHGGSGEDPDFDIWSAGADGRFGSKDDITNGFKVKITSQGGKK